MVSVQYQSSLPIKPSFPPAHLSCSLHRQETDVPHFLCLSTDNLATSIQAHGHNKYKTRSLENIFGHENDSDGQTTEKQRE